MVKIKQRTEIVWASEAGERMSAQQVAQLIV
jgi:hypothetical protein